MISGRHLERRILLATSALIAVVVCWLANSPGIHPRSGDTASGARDRPARPLPGETPAFATTWAKLLGELERLTEDPDLPEVASAAAGGVAAEHLAAAIDFATRGGPTRARQEVVARLLLRWAESDPGAVAERAGRGLQPYLMEEYVAALFALLHARDAGAATRFAAAMEHCAARDAMVAAAVGPWAAADWAGVLAWLGPLPEGPAKVCALEVLLREIDPVRLRDLAASFATLPSENAGLHRRFVGGWAMSDPIRAIGWAEQLPAGDVRDGVLPLALARWAADDPLAAAGYVAAMPPGPTRTEAAANVASAWARHDVVAAANWVTRIPDETLRLRAVEKLVATWAEPDPLAAVRWLAGSSEGPAVDRGLAMLSGRLGAIYPQAAFDLAAGIGAVELRWRQLEIAARLWMERDPAAARAGIAHSDLPVAVKTRLAARIAMVPASSP